jgi:hypothetical protein
MNTTSVFLPSQRVGSTSRNLISRWAVGVWSNLERIGQQRAIRELVLTAERFDSSESELAQQLRAVAREWRSQ